MATWFTGEDVVRRASPLIAALVATLAGQFAFAQPNAAPAPENGFEALSRFQGVAEQFKQLGDWDANAEIIRGVMDQTWETNGWKSEADEFARRTAIEVAQLPPWDFQGRVRKLSEMVGERYQFADSQRHRLEASIYSESGWFLVKNFKAVMEQTQETISARAQGRPFTPEQIAEWTRGSEALMADARERVQRLAHSMEKTMTPAQRRLLQEDMESYERRRAHVDRLRERWARGEWRPEDWGLDKDPIQNPNAGSGAPAASQPAAAALPDGVVEERAYERDETTWERYVREFIARYELDVSQREAALSILRELQARASDYRSSRKSELVGLPASEALTHPLLRPISQMFEELRSRLEAIPTDRQRSTARGSPP